MNIVTVKNLKLGEGRPKICVPVMASAAEEVLHQARRAAGSCADLIEWRADAFEAFKSADANAEIIRELKGIMGERPVLFTIRTKQEGGNGDVTAKEYLELVKAASADADLVDAELSAGQDALLEITETAHKNDCKVIGSNHDFFHTPADADLEDRMRRMQAFGCDIAKLAVMPENEQDVLRLMSVTLRMKAELHVPVITMSMGKLGVVSRLCGTLDGSCLTFGTCGEASAPGQIPCEKLAEILDILY